MGTRLRVTALEVRDHPDAVVRGFPIAEVVILPGLNLSGGTKLC